MLPLRLKNGATVMVETTPPAAPESGDALPDSGDDLLPEGVAMHAGLSVPLPAREFGEAVKVVEGIAEELGERLGSGEESRGKRMRLKELELGVKVGFDAKGNVFIAGGSASASLELKLKWQLGEATGNQPEPA